MRLWRLSGKLHAQSLDGGYGLHFDGRWNTIGHAVTYCATSPSLCVLEKMVHIEDPALMPDLVMVTYDVPERLGVGTVEISDLPRDWRHEEAWTQQKGDAWHEARSTPLLQLPSAVVPIEGSPDLNVMINHTHPASAAIRIARLEPFMFDMRLFEARHAG